MPSFSDFFTKFGWPELIITLAIILGIASSHEWRNVLGIFTHDTKKKKEGIHKEE